MEVDSTLKLKITGTKANVTWTTSKKSVATVSNAGTVTAKAEGKATITATVNSKKYSCKVTVVDSNKATLTPIPTDTPRISPTPTPIPEPEESSDMEMLNETEIKDLTIHPDKYLGKYAEFPAKIITEPVVDGSVYNCLICQDMEKNTKIIYIEYFDRPGLKKGDKLLFFGYLETMYHGPGVDGNNIEAPLMIIKGMDSLAN